MWAQLAEVGRASSGGYLRFGFTEPDLVNRAWFVEQAKGRGLEVETDRNGNQWAWWGSGRTDAVVTGSHLDSVPHGGAFDGPLGVVSAFLAVDALREQGFMPGKPIGIVNFAEEEGSRFGVACLGSRLACGALDPEKALALMDERNVTLRQALLDAELDPDDIGPDPDRVNGISAFVEVHVEQGKALAHTEHSVALASAIWPHGRWQFDFAGEANHAGTTALVDRHDPMIAYASTVLAARQAAQAHGGVATFGKVHALPNATNAVAEQVTAWLDCRAPDEELLVSIVDEIRAQSNSASARHAVGLAVVEQSRTAIVEFDQALRDRLNGALGNIPVLPTGAGHDAGVLSAHVPTAMVFVRNPTGHSHSPLESASVADCLVGIDALVTVLKDLAG
jgi:N-carbamoyl-L-amino-acid hydrolase